MTDASSHASSPRARVACATLALRHIDGLSACDHILDLVGAFLDFSVHWDVPRAARHGLLHLLQHFASQRLTRQLTAHELACAVEIAASKGHLPIIQWAHALPHSSSAFSVKLMNFAAFAGHLDVLQWLHANRNEGCSTKALDGAACCGHMDVVQWLHENRVEGCTVDAMDSAAVNGHLDVVRFLHFHRTEGCTTRAMDVAASNGDLKMLTFLYENRTEGCTALAIKSAARGSRFNTVPPRHSVTVLQFLFERYRSLFTRQVVELCRQIGPIEVVEWVETLGILETEPSQKEGGDAMGGVGQ